MINSIVSSLNASDPGSDPVGITMLRKTLDMQSQGVAQLLQSMPGVGSAGINPPHLGQNIDIKV